MATCQPATISHAMEHVAPLAGQIVAALAPFLPRLIRAGHDALAGSPDDSLEADWRLAEDIWRELEPRLEARPTAVEAAREVADNPSDADSIGALRVQVRKVLAENDQLRASLSAKMDRAANVRASAPRSVAIGGDVHDSTIITGDRNQIGD